MAGQENKYSDLITSYAMSLPLVIGKRYCFPSLSLLSKYWQDPSGKRKGTNIDQLITYNVTI